MGSVPRAPAATCLAGSGSALAGFFGALRAGTVDGGLRAGLVTGLIASLTVPGDYLIRHNWFPTFGDAAFTLVIAAAVCMLAAGLGAAVVVLVKKGPRTQVADRWARHLRGLADGLQPERLQFPES